MIYYESVYDYVNRENSNNIIADIDNCITVLMTTVLKAVGTANISEYTLNDGQTVIRTYYRDAKKVIEDISALRVVRSQYVADLMGRATRNIDSKNLALRRFGF